MRTLTVLLAFVLSLAADAAAQDFKFGFVQVDMLVQQFPEHEDAAKTYEKELKSWETQLKEYENDLAAMKEEYEQRSMLYSPEKRREKEEEILNKQREAVQFYQQIFGQQGKAEQRKIELLTPIYEKVNRAIDILGERDNFTMIFNAQGLLYAKEEHDLTEDVLIILKAGVDISPGSSRGTGAIRR